MRLIIEKLLRKTSGEDLVAIWMLTASLLFTTFWLCFIAWILPTWQQ
jgi:hypothetical protein